MARAGKSCEAFAKEMGVHRSGMWRYEKEELGVSPSLLTRLLTTVAQQLDGTAVQSPVEKALAHVTQAVHVLEDLKATPKDRSGGAKRRPKQRSV